MEQQFKVGDTNVCTDCNGGIQFQGQYWEHIPVDGPQPRHSAFPLYQPEAESTWIGLDANDVAALLAQLNERDRIIDDLQASARGMEAQIIEDGRRIVELERNNHTYRSGFESAHKVISALGKRLEELEAGRAHSGLGALDLAEKRGRSIIALVDEKIDLRRQLEDITVQLEKSQARVAELTVLFDGKINADTTEALAAYAHEAWAGWMRYMFRFATVNLDGTATLNADEVDRWYRQMNTVYADLPENEKASDRSEASKILAAIRPQDGAGIDF